MGMKHDLIMKNSIEVFEVGYLWMRPRPLLPMTNMSSFKSPMDSQIISLASPQYSFATTFTCSQVGLFLMLCYSMIYFCHSMRFYYSLVQIPNPSMKKKEVGSREGYLLLPASSVEQIQHLIVDFHPILTHILLFTKLWHWDQSWNSSPKKKRLLELLRRFCWLK